MDGRCDRLQTHWHRGFPMTQILSGTRCWPCQGSRRTVRGRKTVLLPAARSRMCFLGGFLRDSFLFRKTNPKTPLQRPLPPSSAKPTTTRTGRASHSRMGFALSQLLLYPAFPSSQPLRRFYRFYAARAEAIVDQPTATVCNSNRSGNLRSPKCSPQAVGWMGRFGSGVRR